jgi:uncharacterized protein YdaU (DUF1376 family)
MHYYQFNISDYQSHTKHLTPIEDICYRRLLDWQYLHEKPIPSDLKSMCRLLMLRDYQDDVEQVLNEFFVLTEDGWVNPRALEEIEEFISFEEKNKTREENEKERKRRHREERKRLFAELREQGIIPGWKILTEPLRELHKIHCGKKAENCSKTTECEPLVEQERTCDAPVTGQVYACDEHGTAITTNYKPLTTNQELLTTHTVEDVPNSIQQFDPTPGARVCQEMKNLGLIDLNPQNPLLLELIAVGATMEEFIHAGKTAKSKGKGFAYALAIVKGQRKEAKELVSQVLHGELPNKSPPKKTPQRENFKDKNYGTGVRSL